MGVKLFLEISHYLSISGRGSIQQVGHLIVVVSSISILKPRVVFAQKVSLLLVLCNHVRTKGIFMGAIYLLIWNLGIPLSRKNYFTKYSTPHK
jgi:hypothetical protein